MSAATCNTSPRAVDWRGVLTALDTDGHAVIKDLLTPAQCTALADLYDTPQRFRSRIVMGRHGFGQGEYQYFAYPLPPLIERLRQEAFGPLASVANRWRERLGEAPAFPDNLDAFLRACHAAGQVRATPLLLRYGAGDYNRLHQDLYGDIVFPLQVAILLSRPGVDFEGGDFVLTEARPRMQSRATVVRLEQGDAVVLTVNHRPVQGARGHHRAQMRHGVSTVLSGRRYTLGVIFHDAR